MGAGRAVPPALAVTDGQDNIDKPQRKESGRSRIKYYFARFFC